MLRTSRAALTNAAHSILGMKPFTKSGLKSASRISTVTSLSWRGKLFDVHPFA